MSYISFLAMFKKLCLLVVTVGRRITTAAVWHLALGSSCCSSKEILDGIVPGQGQAVTVTFPLKIDSNRGNSLLAARLCILLSPVLYKK